MTFQSYSKTLEVIEILREKVLNPKTDHPLKNHYYYLTDKIEKLPSDKFKSYYMKWLGLRRQSSRTNVA